MLRKALATQQGPSLLFHSDAIVRPPRGKPFRAGSSTAQRKRAICEAKANRESSLLDQIGKASVSLVAAGLVLTGSCQAADFVKTGICLFENCPVQLAKCVADPTCAENIICLNNCNGREDESECQIRCGDLYASPAVEQFTKCAVTEKKCVGKRIDKDVYPVPPDSVLAKEFDINKFTGEWSITLGLNSLFDAFDCQVHNFSIEKPGTLHADIKWRIKESSGEFLERSTVQTFDQEEGKPGHLHNGDNEFLNYTDDWYVLDFKPDQYAVIYYRGNNDAWAGYGGLTVYTREREFPEKYRKDVEAALGKVGLSISNLTKVDNTCAPEPKETLFQEIEGAIKDLFPPKEDTAPPPLDPIRNQKPQEDIEPGKAGESAVSKKG